MFKKALEYLGVTPVVVKLVFTLVNLFEVEGNGQEKKAAVLESVALCYDETIKLYPTLSVSKEFVLSVADGTVEIAVRFYNIVGAFKKA